MMTTLRRWGALALEFVLAQGLGQAAGMISGLIFVRIMPIEEYALYALSMTASAFIAVGTDMGQGSALMFFWRRHHTSRAMIARCLAAIHKLRRLSFAVALVLASFIYVNSVSSTSVSGYIVAVCFASGAMTAWIQGISTIDNSVMRLEGRQRQSYFGDLASASMRLVLASAGWIFGATSALIGMFAALCGSVSAYCITRRMRSADLSELPSAARHDVREVGGQIFPLLPSFGIFMLQGPIIYWLAATQGGPHVVAESHALGRIAAVFSLFGTVTSVLIAPRLASYREYKNWVQGVALSAGAIVLFGLGAVAAVAVSPEVPLKLLGPTYAHLELEVVLSVSAAMLTVLNGLLVVSTRMRGWVALEPAVAICQTTVFCMLLAVVSLHTTQDVMFVSLIFAGCSAVFAMSVMIIGHFRPGLVARHAQDGD